MSRRNNLVCSLRSLWNKQEACLCSLKRNTTKFLLKLKERKWGLIDCQLYHHHALSVCASWPWPGHVLCHSRGGAMSVLGTAAYLMPTHCLAGKKEKGIAIEWMNHIAFQQLRKIRPWPPRTYIGLLKTTIKEKKSLDSKYHFLSTERICFKVCKDSTKYFPETSSNEIFC